MEHGGKMEHWLTSLWDASFVWPSIKKHDYRDHTILEITENLAVFYKTRCILLDEVSETPTLSHAVPVLTLLEDAMDPTASPYTTDCSTFHASMVTTTVPSRSTVGPPQQPQTLHTNHLMSSQTLWTFDLTNSQFIIQIVDVYSALYTPLQTNT